MKKIANRDSSDYVINQRDFKVNNLKGINTNDLLYVVYSYAEPIICWISGKGWLVNTTKFSPTTTRHTTDAMPLCKFKPVTRVTSKEMKTLINEVI